MEALQLRDSDFIAEGQKRKVYEHPQESGLCIKVPHEWVERDGTARREVKYWQLWKLLRCDLSRMIAYRGTASTNLGEGSVWELVRNYDGSRSLTLADCLLRRSVTALQCHRELANFRAWMVANRILPTDLHPRNLVCKYTAPGQFRLVQVDGWGNNEFIPVSFFSRQLARRKIDRKWGKMEERLDEIFKRLQVTAEKELEMFPFPTIASSGACRTPRRLAA